jgi:cytochrome P450
MASNATIALRASGPGGGFVFGSAAVMYRKPLENLVADVHRFGPVVRYRFLGTPIYFISHPDGVERVLHTNHANYNKSNFDYRILKRLLGQGLLTAENPLWLRQRRLIQPMFHRQRVAGFGSIMTDEATRMVATWRSRLTPGEPFDVSVEMMQVTLRVVCRALLDLEIGDDAATIAEGLSIVVRVFGVSAISLLLPFLPTRHNRELNRAIRGLRGVVDRIIADRVCDGRDHGDLLSMLLAARDADSGHPMPATQIRDEVLTLLLAGHETTANALAWTFFLLASAPEVEAKLSDELDRALDQRPPTIEDLPRLPFTAMVIQEAMRLYPPAWAISRAALADDVILGYRIPAGSVVLLSQWVTHRHPDFWDEPLRFRPERFAPEEVARRSRYAYFPFGGGPRLCIGEQFATVEARLILATVAQSYRLRLCSDQPVEPEPLVTLRPRNGMRMLLEPIARAAAA